MTRTISNTTQGRQQINETQDIDNTTSAGGAFILTYNGVSTALINFDADAADDPGCSGSYSGFNREHKRNRNNRLYLVQVGAGIRLRLLMLWPEAISRQWF